MVFFADIRIDIKVELNANHVIQLLEEATQRKLNPDVNVEKDVSIYDYVNRLECDYSNFVNKIGFYEWFDENYDNNYEYEEIMELFEEEEQYNAVCDCDDCNVVLDIDTHIFVHIDKEKNEMVVCHWCYFDNDMWKTDKNPDNADVRPKKLKFKVKKS